MHNGILRQKERERNRERERERKRQRDQDNEKQGRCNNILREVKLRWSRVNYKRNMLPFVLMCLSQYNKPKIEETLEYLMYIETNAGLIGPSLIKNRTGEILFRQ